ncbi:RNA-directed DNA polymerase, eukaryota [Tanacetum coccineum]
MGDFNEVRTQDERHGSIFNAHGADAFNLFISSAGLEEVPLDGCKFTWCHKSGSKMSKLDRFLISEGLLNSCPNISSITLDRYLSDHRPILMRESHHDYGPSPFRFFHYWFELEGFDTFVKQTWNDAQVTDSNAISMFMKKMKYLKEKIRRWIESPILVKDEFLSYFASRFNKPPDYRLHIDLDFPNKLSLEQQMVLEIKVTREEIKKAVWDCGVDKSPGPDGFTFASYRR